MAVIIVARMNRRDQEPAGGSAGLRAGQALPAMLNVFLVFLWRDLATRQVLGEMFPCPIPWPEPTGLAAPNHCPHPEPDHDHRDDRHHDPHEIHLPVLHDWPIALLTMVGHCLTGTRSVCQPRLSRHDARSTPPVFVRLDPTTISLPWLRRECDACRGPVGAAAYVIASCNMAQANSQIALVPLLRASASAN